MENSRKIIVYYADIENLDLNKTSMVPVSRQNKILSYKFINDQKRSLAAWLLVQKIPFKKYVNNYIFDFNNIEYNDFGKPYFNGSPIKFNISHSGKYAICAWSKYDLGCDIQKIDPINTKLVDYCMNQKEIDDIYDTSSSKVNIANINVNKFYEYWTIKESYMKAEGVGLYITPKKINIKELINYNSFTIDNKYTSSVCLAEQEKKCNLNIKLCKCIL